MLDPVIVSALINPVRRTGGLSTDDEELLEMVADGRTIKAIAGAERTTPAAVDERVERLFVTSPRASRAARPAPSTACAGCTRRSSSARSRARA